MTKDEHRSTVRVLSILLALSNTPDGLTLAELSQQLAAPKSSLFPIVHTMADQYCTFELPHCKKQNFGQP